MARRKTAAERADAILNGGRTSSGRSRSSASSRAAAILEGKGSSTRSSAASRANAILGTSTPSASKGKTNVVLSVLSALDTGRRGVTAVVKELDDLVPGITRGDRAAATGFKLSDIKKNYDQNVGAGDLVQSGPLNYRRAVGFLGDVAVDPLSYLTLGAAPLAKGAAKGANIVSKDEVARKALKIAAESGDEGMAEVASRVARRGTGALSAEEAATLGIRQGAQLGFKNAKVTIPGTGAVARAANTVSPLGLAADKLVYGAGVGGAVGRALNAIDPGNKLSRTGLPRAEAFSPEGPIQRLLLVDQARLAKGEARAMAQGARQSLESIIQTRGKDVATSRQLWESLQGAAPANAGVAAAVSDIRKLMDNTRQEASRLAGRELGYVDSYLPVTFGKELRALLDEKRGTGTRLAKTKPEKQRKVFVEGGKFLGETLHGATPSDVLAHAERVAKDKLGDDALTLFETNPAKLIDRYIRGVERFAADHGLARRLGTTLDDVRSVEASGLGPRLDNARRLADVATDTSPSRIEERELRAQAEALWERADELAQAGDHVPASVATLEADALAEMATTPALSDEAFRSAIEDGTKVTDTAVAALKVLSGNDAKWVGEALLNLQKANAFVDSGWFVKAFDKATNTWKSFAILSPGFHARNYAGGIFNNALAGVDGDSYRLFATNYSRYRQAFKEGGPRKALDAVDEEYRDAFAEMQRVGLFNSTTGRDFADVTDQGAGWLQNNRLQRLNRKGATGVENNLRGTLAFDRIKKGASIEDALGAVAKYHFQYDEVSPFFRNYVKRAIPFATWSRFNLPLQIEGIARKPGLYTRFVHLAHNIEMGQDDNDPTTIGEAAPSWMKSLMAIKSPFLSPGGQSMFLTLDLPFRDLGESVSMDKLKSQLNPLAKLPLEASAGKKFFNDVPLRDTPAQNYGGTRQWILAPLYVLSPVLSRVGGPKVSRKDGEFVISDRDANKVETLIPMLGQMKRLLPADEKSQEKALSSWLSYALGISTQTLVESSALVAEASREMSKRTRRTTGTSGPVEDDTPTVRAPRSAGIRPQGKNAPRNAIIYGTQNAKPYRGGP